MAITSTLTTSFKKELLEAKKLCLASNSSFLKLVVSVDVIAIISTPSILLLDHHDPA